jgi:hypothetical protein
MAYYDYASFGGLFNKSPSKDSAKEDPKMKVKIGTEGYDQFVKDVCKARCPPHFNNQNEKQLPDNCPFEHVLFFDNNDPSREENKITFKDKNGYYSDSWRKKYLMELKVTKGKKSERITFMEKDNNASCKSKSCPEGFYAENLLSGKHGSLKAYFENKTIYEIKYNGMFGSSWKAKSKSSFGRRKQGVSSEIKYLLSL